MIELEKIITDSDLGDQVIHIGLYEVPIAVFMNKCNQNDDQAAQNMVAVNKAIVNIKL